MKTKKIKEKEWEKPGDIKKRNIIFNIKTVQNVRNYLKKYELKQEIENAQTR